MSSIYFGGSRYLQSSPIIPQVIQSVLALGHSVQVGCALGGDALVIASVVPSSFSQVRVFSAFAQSGAGSTGYSNIEGVQAFAQQGGRVSWLAGGELSVPLRARLIKRSLAGLQGCSQAVFFSPGAGSLAVAGHAVKQGAQVFAFSSAIPSCPRGCVGSWAKGYFVGFPCHVWQGVNQLSFL